MKNQNKSAGTAATKKATKPEVTKANLNSAKEKAKAKEEVGRKSKYIYPADCTEDNQRKEFRRKARQTRDDYSEKIAELKKAGPSKEAELKKLIKEKKAWEAETYAPNEE